MKSRFGRLLRRLEADWSVLYGIAANVWGLVSGPVTLLLVATYFSPTLQGFYYTFGTMVGLQWFVELGLSYVVVQFASHEWASLGLDPRGRVVGDPRAQSRLASLARSCFRWYPLIAGAVAVGVGAAGYVLFSRDVYDDVAWRAPWVALCVLTAMSIWLLPAWSLLEGCNQIAPVFGFKAKLGVLNSAVIWLAILSGADLWTSVLSAAVTVLASGAFLTLRYGEFFASLWSGPGAARIDWRSEVWPMQWRTGLRYICDYFILWIFTPVAFHYHGAVVAGQMGMTWALIWTSAAIPYVWARVKAPQFGMLVAKRNYAELNRVFYRVAAVSLGCLGALMGGLWVLIYLLNVFEIPFAARLLAPLPSGLFLLGQVAMSATGPLVVYLRAHKKEPLLGVTAGSGLLIGVLTWLLGARFGVIGMGAAYLAVAACFTLPATIFVWSRCRAHWHTDEPGVPAASADGLQTAAALAVGVDGHHTDQWPWESWSGAAGLGDRPARGRERGQS